MRWPDARACDHVCRVQRGLFVRPIYQRIGQSRELLGLQSRSLLITSPDGEVFFCPAVDIAAYIEGACMARMTLPGLIDVHVHFRQPGGEHKETYSSGTAAALAGGVTTVLDMPNTTPPTTDGARLAAKRKLAAENARCDVGIFLGATSDNAEQVAAASPAACGLKIYVSTTFGPLQVADWS